MQQYNIQGHVVEEMECLAERLRGPGVQGYEAEWLEYVREQLLRFRTQLKTGITVLCMAILLGCAGGGGGESDAAEPSLPHTRTVCVAPDSADLAPHVTQAVDVWNDRDTRPLSDTCTAFVRCLPKAVAHELGHALGILWHPAEGLMSVHAVRGPLMHLTDADFAALPADAPTLLYVDEEQPCDHEVGWGYPSESVLAGELAWYELATRKIWIEPSPKWRD